MKDEYIFILVFLLTPFYSWFMINQYLKGRRIFINIHLVILVLFTFWTSKFIYDIIFYEPDGIDHIFLGPRFDLSFGLWGLSIFGIYYNLVPVIMIGTVSLLKKQFDLLKNKFILYFSFLVLYLTILLLDL